MQLAKTIAYWTTTALLALAMAGSAAGYLSGAMNEAMGDHLGYPAHFILLLGAWKGLGAIGLLVPALPRLKEWVYAGFFFTFTGAALAHVAVGDGVGEVVAPLVMLVLLSASYLLRPARLWAGASPFVSSPTAAIAAK